MLKQWILGITCAAVIGALAESLSPEGGAKRVGRLAAGLLLFLAVVRPLAQPDWDALSAAVTRYRLEAAGYAQALEEENRELVKAVIEARTAAYISDKAAALGAECTARVVYRWGEDGEILPQSVTLRGSFTDGQRADLSRTLEGELGIRAEDQTFEGVIDQ